MPLVEYRCSGCGSVFERLVPRTDSAQNAECPVCRATQGKRVISLIAASVRGGDGASTGGCCGGACGCGSG